VRVRVRVRVSLVLQALPSLLSLQLKRFDVDYQIMDRVKVGREGGREGGRGGSYLSSS